MRPGATEAPGGPVDARDAGGRRYQSCNASPSPAPGGALAVPACTTGAAGADSNSPSVASPHGRSGAITTAACKAAAMPSGPSSVEAR